MTMTLEQVRDLLDSALAGQTGSRVTIHATRAKQARDVLDAHLSQPAQSCGGCGNDDPAKRCLNCRHDFQPAQAVDVGAIREVITELKGVNSPLLTTVDERHRIGDKLTRALSTAQAEVRGVDGWRIEKGKNRAFRLSGPNAMHIVVERGNPAYPFVAEFAAAKAEQKRARRTAHPAPDKEGK